MFRPECLQLQNVGRVVLGPKAVYNYKNESSVTTYVQNDLAEPAQNNTASHSTPSNNISATMNNNNSQAGKFTHQQHRPLEQAGRGFTDNTDQLIPMYRDNVRPSTSPSLVTLPRELISLRTKYIKSSVRET